MAESQPHPSSEKKLDLVAEKSQVVVQYDPEERLRGMIGSTEKRQPLADYIVHARLERELEHEQHLIDTSHPNASRSRFSQILLDLGLDEQVHGANRVLKAATWFNVFTLITTDVLGPMFAPWAISQMGYVPGVLVYFFFGVITVYTGWQLSALYLELASTKYPMSTLSEVGNRVFGGPFKAATDAMQTIQFIVLVSGTILSNGQALSQISSGKVCFSALMIIFTAAGMIINQIRSLKNLAKITSANVFINLFILFCTMGVAAHSLPNYTAAGIPAAPVVTAAFVKNSLSNKLVGVMNIVYAYGGAMMFIEFIAEMKRPVDFWKGMICAELLIVCCYLLYGVFMYSQQGQFTINPANQGLSPFKWQTAMNALSLFTTFVAGSLYANVGLKVFYYGVIERYLRGPPLMSNKGRFVWAVEVFIYYAFAFIVSSAIPQFSNISGFFAASLLLPFTYSFPPLLMIGFRMQKNALRAGLPQRDLASREWWMAAFGFRKMADIVSVDGNLSTNYEDNHTPSIPSFLNFGTSFKIPSIALISFDTVLFLASLAAMGLGMWSCIEGMIESFAAAGAASSFGCKSPVT